MKTQSKASKKSASIHVARRTAARTAIASLAPSLASELRAQGWEGDGSTYHLHAAPGDAQAFEEVIGRDSDHEERVDLERAIRAELTRLHEVRSTVSA